MSVNKALINSVETIHDLAQRKFKQGKLKEALIDITRLDDDLKNAQIYNAPICCLAIKICIKLATKKPKQATKVLTQAEDYLRFWKTGMKNKRMKLKLKIFDKFSDIYRKSKQYHKAIHYILKSHKLCERQTKPQFLPYFARSKLILCELYCELRRFKEAKELAEQSMAIIQSQISLNFSSTDQSSWTVKQRNSFFDLITNLAIAFFNVGVAEEGMGNVKMAQAAYKNAVTLSDKYLDEYTPIYNMAHSAYDEIQYQTEFEDETQDKPEEIANLKVETQSTGVTKTPGRRSPARSRRRENRVMTIMQQMLPSPQRSPQVKPDTPESEEKFDTEHFFAAKITQMLDLGEDPPIGQKKKIELQDYAKEEIKKLYDRKNMQMETAPIRSLDFIHKRMDILQKELEDERKKASITEISQTHTKRPASHPKSLWMYHLKEPPQRLRFAQPAGETWARAFTAAENRLLRKDYDTTDLPQQISQHKKDKINQVIRENLESLRVEVGKNIDLLEAQIHPNDSKMKLQRMSSAEGQLFGYLKNYNSLGESTQKSEALVRRLSIKQQELKEKSQFEKLVRLIGRKQNRKELLRLKSIAFQPIIMQSLRRNLRKLASF